MDVGGEGWNMTSSCSEPEYTMVGRPAERSGRYEAKNVDTCHTAYREGPETKHRKRGKWNN